MSDGVILVTGKAEAPIQRQAEAAANSLAERMASSPTTYNDPTAIARAMNEYWNNFYKNLNSVNDLIKKSMDTSKLDMTNSDVKAKVDQIEIAYAKLLLEVAKDGYLDFSSKPGVDFTSTSARQAFEKIKFDLRYNDRTFDGGETTYTLDGTPTVKIDIFDGPLFARDAAAGLNYILFHELGHSMPGAFEFQNKQGNDFQNRTHESVSDPNSSWKSSQEFKNMEAYANATGYKMAQEAGMSWPTQAEIDALYGYFMM